MNYQQQPASDTSEWGPSEDVALLGSIVLLGIFFSGAFTGSNPAFIVVALLTSALVGVSAVLLRRFTNFCSIEDNYWQFWKSFALFAGIAFVPSFLLDVSFDLRPTAQQTLAVGSLIIGLVLGHLHYRAKT